MCMKDTIHMKEHNIARHFAHCKCVLMKKEKEGWQKSPFKNERGKMIKDHTWQDFATNSKFGGIQKVNSFDFQVYIC